MASLAVEVAVSGTFLSPSSFSALFSSSALVSLLRKLPSLMGLPAWAPPAIEAWW